METPSALKGFFRLNRRYVSLAIVIKWQSYEKLIYIFLQIKALIFADHFFSQVFVFHMNSMWKKAFDWHVFGAQERSC